MGRRIGKSKAEDLAQTLEDKADTARWFPLAIAGWALSISIRGALSVFGMRKGDV